MLLHGDNLLTRKMMPKTPGEPARDEGLDTRKMSKEEYKAYIDSQMRGIKWN